MMRNHDSASRRAPWARSALLLGLLLALSTAAVAQRLDGTLRGEVRDATGAVVAGATVVATNQETGVQQSTQTTSQGAYVFPNLIPGTYDVEVKAAGFQTAVRNNVRVNSNQVTDVQSQLTVGAEDTVVEVVAGSEVVKTTTSQLGETIPEQAVRDIPIATLGGSPLELAVGLPNVIPNPGGVVGTGGSVGGNRPRNNNFSIDGVDNNDITVTGPTSPVIQDAVQELTVLTNQFSAEHGRSAGGQFNIITQTGTNDLRGGLWYYFQNRDLNALDNLQEAAIENGEIPGKPRFDFNRVGGKVGGPLIRDRLFLFGAYEYQTRGEAATGVTIITPTQAGLDQLSGMAANDAVRSVIQAMPAANNPTGTELVNGVAIPIGELQSFAPDFDNQHDFQINGDLNLTSHQIRGRFLYDRFRAPNLNAQLPLDRFTGNVEFDARTAILADVWSVTPTLVNDLRASFSRSASVFGVPDEFANFPQVIVDTLGMNLGPQGNSPQSGIQNVYSLQDNMSYVTGGHSLKWGGEYKRWIAPSDFLPRARGEYDYANLQQLVNDQVPSGLNGALRGAGTGLFPGDQHAIYGYFQDDWKMTPRFTVNLGLRYEYYTVPEGAKSQALNSLASVPGVLEFGVPETDTNNIMPRVGFAWDIFGDGRTSVRGGFGVSFDVLYQNLPLLALPPQLQTEQNPVLSCTLDPSLAYCPVAPGGAFQSGFLASGGLLQTNVPPQTPEEARTATQGLIPDVTLPKVLTWSLGIQREVWDRTSIEVRYLGTRSTQLPVQIRLNSLPAFNAGIAPLPVFFSEAEVPATITDPASTQQDFINHLTCATTCFLRFLEQGFDGSLLTTFPPAGSQTYHSGSVDFVHQFTRGLYLRTNYTYAKNMDNSTNDLFTSRVNPRRPENPLDLAGEWGRSVLDIRHKFALSWVYEFPTMDTDSGFVGALVNGWQFNGTWLAQTGQPITALSGTDANADFDSAADRAIFNPSGTQVAGSDTNAVVIDPGTGSTSICTAGCDPANVVGYVVADPNAQWVITPLGAQSNIARNTVDTPGLNIGNVSLFKNFRMGERRNLQFRAEFFNVLNHRNFSLAAPSVFGFTGNALSATYANVSSVQFLDETQFSGGARSVQLGLKFNF